MPTLAITEERGPPLTLIYRHPDGKDADVDAVAFAEFIVQSVRALTQTASLLEGRPVHIRYVIESLDKNSPETVALSPITTISDAPIVRRVQAQHVQTLEGIRRGLIPDFLDYPALQTYERLGELARKGNFVADVRVNGTSAIADAGLKNTIDLTLARERVSTGSVRGTIKTYQSAGNRRLIRIYPRAGASLLGHFRERDRTLVKSLVDGPLVEVEGRMRYKPGAYQPYFVDIEKIRPLDFEGSPSFADMAGFAPALIGEDQSPEDFVGDLRDAW